MRRSSSGISICEISRTRMRVLSDEVLSQYFSHRRAFLFGLFRLVSALAKSRATSRLVRTMAGDSRNLPQTWLDSSGNLVVYMSSNAVWPKKHWKSVEMHAKCCLSFLLSVGIHFNTFSVFFGPNCIRRHVNNKVTRRIKPSLLQVSAIPRYGAH